MLVIRASFILALSTLGFLVPPPPASSAGPDCGEQVCLYSSSDEKSGSYKVDAKLSKKNRRKEAKKQKKQKDVELAVVILDGRGSAFVDGRYLPKAGMAIKPGKHELEIRDGEQLVSRGVLSIPRRIDSMTVEVHADR